MTTATFQIEYNEATLLIPNEYLFQPCDNDSDYDDGTDDSCMSRDWDSEPGDDYWLADQEED